MRITTPGIYEMPTAEYHADPCDQPSLSSGVAKLLIRRSPLHAHHAHPRFGGAAIEPTATMDAGSILHRLILGAGGDYEAVDADDWRTKAAQTRRDEIRAAGLVPVLARALEELRDAAEAALDQMKRHPDCADFFAPGRSEAVIAWQEGDAWCRCMVDRQPDDPRAPMFDVKTTGMSAAPVDFQRAVIRDHAFQDAFYTRGARAVGRRPRRFIFIAVEQKPPHAIATIAAAPSLLDVAEGEVGRAIAVWQNSLRTGLWPGYPTRTAYVDAPAWPTAAEQAANMEDEAA